MKFPLVSSYGGLQFRLLLIRPNWEFSPVVTHRIDTMIGEGRTSIEERRPARAHLLLSQKITIAPSGSDADDWRKGLAALGALPVGVPLWPDALPVAAWATRIYDPAHVINFDPATGDYALYAGDDLPAEPAYPLYAPLLLGRWKKPPAATVQTAEDADIELELTEASPWSWRIGINSYGSAWTQEPNWVSPLRDALEFGLEQISLGAAREPALDRTSSAARWTQEADFWFLTRLQLRTALSWFVAQGGALEAWSPVPAWFQPGTPTGATPDTYTARFASDTLTLTYDSDESATARIGWIQEVDTGERAQALAGEAWLYRLDYKHDLANPELLTGWDAPLTVTEGAYQPAQVAHQEILRSLKPQDEKAEVKFAYVAGSLLADWQLGRLYGWLRLTIWRCDPTDAGGSRGAPMFQGYVKEVLPEGNLLSVTATLFGRLLDRRVPGDVSGPNCNTWLFSRRCGLDEADHDSAGTSSAADLSGDGLTLTVHSVTGWGGTTYADNWFARGILRTGAARTTQVVTILSSTMSSGNVVVKLARPLWADLITTDQAVTLIPGCGLQYETDCGDKFDNQVNFRGMPFIPEFIDQRDATSSPAKTGK